MTSAWDSQGDVNRSITNVGEGWHPLIRDLEKELNLLSPRFRLHQVKEKFGGLRYYADPQDGCTEKAVGDFRAAIARAEDQSFHICEECGADGQTQNIGHWIKTLCETHRNERRAELKQRFS